MAQSLAATHTNNNRLGLWMVETSHGAMTANGRTPARGTTTTWTAIAHPRHPGLPAASGSASVSLLRCIGQQSVCSRDTVLNVRHTVGAWILRSIISEHLDDLQMLRVSLGTRESRESVGQHHQIRINVQLQHGDDDIRLALPQSVQARNARAGFRRQRTRKQEGVSAPDRATLLRVRAAVGDEPDEDAANEQRRSEDKW